MLKLRILLLCNWLYYIILGIAIVYFVITINIQKTSIYKAFNNEKFIITKIQTKDYGIRLELKGKEKVLGYLYIEEKEINIFKKTYSLGDQILINGEIKEITNNTLENTFNYKKYLYNQRIYNVIEITSIKLLKKNNNLFYKAKNILYQRSNKLKLSYPYINSLIFNNNNDIDEDIQLSYQDNGISHLFSISGDHIAIFIILLEKLLKKIKVKENNRYIILVLFLIFYMFLTDYSMSVVRGSIFAALIIINKLFYFHIKTLNLLLLTLAIIIFFNPLYLYNVGLQFSFIISLFLVLFSNLINKQKNYFTKLIITSIIAFLASYPISVNNFYQINLLSIIYNLFYVPYVAFILLPATLIAYIAPFIDKTLYILVQIIESSSQFINQISISKIILSKMNTYIIAIYYIGLYILLRLATKNKMKYLLIIIPIIFIHYFMPIKKDNYYLTLDIGQGDSSLLVIDNNVSLIDTGGILSFNNQEYKYPLSKNKTIPYLKSKGIRKINNMFLTHGDSDHLKEAIYLIKNFKIDNIYLNNNEINYLEKEIIKESKKRNINIIHLDKNDCISLYTNKICNLNKEQSNENDSSLVLYTNINNYKLLLTGDISKKIEKELINEYNLKNINILKLAHHGSDRKSVV